MLPVARPPTDEEADMSNSMKDLQERLKVSAYYLTDPKKAGGNKYNECYHQKRRREHAEEILD